MYEGKLLCNDFLFLTDNTLEEFDLGLVGLIGRFL